MKTNTQWWSAYQYMKEHGSLTSLTALTKLGIISFPKRICEMEQHGIKVERKRITVLDRNGDPKQVNEYSLNLEESENYERQNSNIHG